MPCYYPVGTYRKSGEACMRPCSGCVGCRLDHARSWAIRCMHEASLNEENCFITLTYNNQNLPKDGSVEKSELQNFIKRLRRKIEPNKIRYFGCGEYGEKFSRPHYHVCIFGYNFPDKQALFIDPKRARPRWKQGHDHTLYRSETLERLWKKGYSTIGEVTFQSAGYVARYVMKKVTGDEKDNHYQEMEPEFALMSRSGGLGKKWLEKYHNDVYPKDFTTINGIKYQPPKYYDVLYERWYPERFKIIKEKRRIHSDEKVRDDWREYQKERHSKKVTSKTLDRRLHSGNN